MSSAYSPGAALLYFQTVPASGNDLVSFYIDDFQLSYVPPPTIQTNIPSIYRSYADLFPIGTAVDTTDLSGPHAQLLTMHFDSMTPGNDLKWSTVEPSLGSYDYTNGDAEVGEAVCAKMRVRGQNLVWSTAEQTPAYATGDGTNSAANQALVTSNIQEHMVVAPTKFPVTLGDIPASSSVSTTVTLNFASCEPNVRFRVKAPWSSATYETGVLEIDMSQ
jgi:endo-1,4-beta-xylanase